MKSFLEAYKTIVLNVLHQDDFLKYIEKIRLFLESSADFQIHFFRALLFILFYFSFCVPLYLLLLLNWKKYGTNEETLPACLVPLLQEEPG